MLIYIVEERLKCTFLKTWQNYSNLVKPGKDTSNLKRQMTRNLDKLDSWLGEIGLKLDIVELNNNENADKNQR